MTRDFGFAPNPFWGICTLANCKPKIRRSAQIGDWIIGTGAITCGLEKRLIYLMEVNEIILFEEYWNNPKYISKKPLLNGSLVQIHGDNIYSKHSENDWKQLNSHHSFYNGKVNSRNLKTDIGGKFVLLSHNFYYFGENHIQIPNEYEEICCNNRDFIKIKNVLIANSFVEWVSKTYSNGVLGDPLDWKAYHQFSLW